MAGLDTNTKLLIHCNGVDGAFEIDDAGDTGHVVTQNADAQLKTDQQKFGSTSCYFDGTGDYLSIPDHADWALPGDFTLDCWVRFPSVGVNQAIYQQYVTDNDQVVWIWDTGGNFSFTCHVGGSNSGRQAFFSWSPSINTWYHVAVVKNSGTLDMYADGTALTLAGGSKTYGTIPDMAAAANIGRSQRNGTQCNAWIDEFRFSKGIARWTTNFTPPTSPHTSDSNTKLLLHMDTRDVSDSSHIPDFKGTAQIDTSESKFGGGSLLLDGNSDYVQIPDSSDWDIVGTVSDIWTVDTQVKFTDHTGSEFLIVQTVDSSNQWVIRHTDGSGFRFYFNLLATSYAETPYGGEVADTAWHHVCLVVYGTGSTNQFGVYVDGIQVGYSTESTTTTFSAPLEIGQRGDDTNYLAGNMDEVRVQKSNYFSAVPLPAPYAWYKCNDIDDTTTVIDDGSGANNGTANVNTDNYTSDAKVQDGVFNEAAQFRSASSQYLSIPDHANWDPNIANLTIDFWVKFDSFTQQVVIGQYESSSYYWNFQHEAGTGWRFLLKNVTFTNDFTSNYEITDKLWHHVALIMTSSRTAQGIYVDGQQVAYSTDTDTGVFSGPLYVGQTGDGTFYMNGHLDDVRFERSNAFSAAPNAGLTDTITVPISAHTATGTTSLLLHFDGNFTDSGDTVHTVTNNAGVTVGNAFDFNGSSEYVNVNALGTDVASDTTGTITAWINTDTISSDSYVLSFCKTATNENTLYFGRDTNTIFAGMSVSDAVQWKCRTTGTIGTGTWYHIALVQDGTSPVLYLNGVADTSFDTTTDKTTWVTDIPNDNGRIGCINFYNLGNLAFWNGKIEDVRYYQGIALTADQVAKLYNEGDGWANKQDVFDVPTEAYSVSAVARNQGVIIV